MLRHFRECFSEDECGIKFSEKKLQTLCKLEWLTFEVGWPDTVLLDSGLVKAVWNKVKGDPRHPAQFPYINKLLDLVQNSSQCLKSCALQIGERVLVAGPRENTVKGGVNRETPSKPDTRGSRPSSTLKSPVTKWGKSSGSITRGAKGNSDSHSPLPPLRVAPRQGKAALGIRSPREPFCP